MIQLASKLPQSLRSFMKDHRVFKDFFQANSEMFEMAQELNGLGFMSGYSRRLKELEAIAEGKKPKTRWSKDHKN